MSEYISKKALMEKFKYMADYNIDMDYVTAEDIMSIPSVDVKEYRWIPVTERLPEEDTKVYLACCDDGYVVSIMYSGGKWLIADANIIAWMPLPEPYKADM